VDHEFAGEAPVDPEHLGLAAGGVAPLTKQHAAEALPAPMPPTHLHGDFVVALLLPVGEVNEALQGNSDGGRQTAPANSLGAAVQRQIVIGNG